MELQQNEASILFISHQKIKQLKNLEPTSPLLEISRAVAKKRKEKKRKQQFIWPFRMTQICCLMVAKMTTFPIVNFLINYISLLSFFFFSPKLIFFPLNAPSVQSLHLIQTENTAVERSHCHISMQSNQQNSAWKTRSGIKEHVASPEETNLSKNMFFSTKPLHQGVFGTVYWFPWNVASIKNKWQVKS